MITFILMDEAARLMVRGPVAMGFEKTAAKAQLERMDVSSEGKKPRCAVSTSYSSPLRAC